MNNSLKILILITESAPRWRPRPPPVVQMPLQHQTLTLRCEASGRPRPTVEWRKNGMPIHYTDKVVGLVIPI